MSRKYGKYKKYYRYGSIFKLTKAERTMFDVIYEISKTIYISIISIFKATVEISHYVRRMVINFFALKKIGYNLNELLDEIYKMTPIQFEIFIAELFKQNGHEVKITPTLNNEKLDIVLDGHIFVECRYYSKNTKISLSMVQELLNSNIMYKGDKCIMVTTGDYTMDSLKYGNQIDNLELMDIVDIEQMLLDLKPEQIGRIIMKIKNVA